MKEIRFERKWIFDNQLFNQLEIKLRRSKFNFVKSFIRINFIWLKKI